MIDLFAVFALLAGTATTFSLATPLLSEAVCDIFSIQSSRFVTIIILVFIGLAFSMAVLIGIKGIEWMAKACVVMFLGLTVCVFVGGGESTYIIETGITSIGNLIQNFISMATYLDPLHSIQNGESNFAQEWTIFYWAYWLVWCIATPFFIGMISKGRTIRQMILGTYIAGLAGTFTSFIVYGNYGLALQMKGRLDILGAIGDNISLPKVILSMFHTLPCSKCVILLLILVMVAFYVTTFDSITMVVSAYSYRNLNEQRLPAKRVRAYWSALFIVLPIGLLWSNESLYSLQSVSIIAAFPIGIILILIVISFFKDANDYIRKGGKSETNCNEYN